ncbi:MAG: C40 family peptidase [Bacteroidales bacterium]|nr:C40 family peptidase [Bacteroidales bacterium]
MEHGICLLSIIPVRKEPSEKSEMVTQILFGEFYEIIDLSGNWLNIKLSFDNYEGWIDKKAHNFISIDYFNELNNSSPFITSNIVSQIHEINHNYSLSILCGSSLHFFNENEDTFRIMDKNFKLTEKTNFQKGNNQRQNIIDSAKLYLNSPYLWGGRTPFGIDCSGLTQIVFKLNGIKVPRDANQQAKTGKTVNFIENSKAGDLAFFDNDEGDIIHVGIILNKNEIIHASGKVKIDKIDHQGIFDIDEKIYTHKLRVIKNILE